MSAEDVPALPLPPPTEQDHWPAPETASSDLAAKSSAGGPKSDTMEVDRPSGAQGPHESAGTTGSNPSPSVHGGKPGTVYREKQIKVLV